VEDSAVGLAEEAGADEEVMAAFFLAGIWRWGALGGGEDFGQSVAAIVLLVLLLDGRFAVLVNERTCRSRLGANIRNLIW